MPRTSCASSRGEGTRAHGIAKAATRRLGARNYRSPGDRVARRPGAGARASRACVDSLLAHGVRWHTLGRRLPRTRVASVGPCLVGQRYLRRSEMSHRFVVATAAVSVLAFCSSALAQPSREQPAPGPASSTRAGAAAPIPPFLRNLARRYMRVPPKKIVIKVGKKAVEEEGREGMAILGRAPMRISVAREVLLHARAVGFGSGSVVQRPAAGSLEPDLHTSVPNQRPARARQRVLPHVLAARRPGCWPLREY